MSLILKLDGLALVHADVGGEALDGAIASPADVPLTGGISGQLVLGDDGVRRHGPVFEGF